MNILRPKALDKGIWWDAPWGLVDGCTHVSAGCDHCWSEAMARRFRKSWAPRFRADRLAVPLRARKPAVWAVWNDLFHECVTNEQIAAAFGIMGEAKEHDFMVLTKRPERLKSWLEWLRDEAYQNVRRGGLDFGPKECVSNILHYCWAVAWTQAGQRNNLGLGDTWPPPNVAMGVTVESQEHVWRIGKLLEAWPGLTFVSVEPCLGPVDLNLDSVFHHEGCGDRCRVAGECVRKPLDQVICGGESGSGARPMHPDWARGLRDRCAEAGVPFLLKQLGPNKRAGRLLDGRTHDGWFGDKA